MFFDAFGGVLVVSRMYVSTSALLSCYEHVFITKKIAYFMISEFWIFGLQYLFVRTPEPFFSNLRTFGLKNLRTREPSNLRTFGLIGCILYSASVTITLELLYLWITVESFTRLLHPQPMRQTKRIHIHYSGVTDSPPHFSSAPNPNLTLT